MEKTQNQISSDGDTEILEIEDNEGSLSDYLCKNLRNNGSRVFKRPNLLEDLREYENPTWITKQYVGRN